MNPLSKVARERRAYTRCVQNRLAANFHLSEVQMAEQNNRWRNWVELGLDPHTLLMATVNDAYKARAIAVMLAPDLRLAPFPWREDHWHASLLTSGHGQIVLSTLLPRLLLFTIELLELNVDFVISNADRSLRRALVDYYEYLIGALAVLPEDHPLSSHLFRCCRLIRGDDAEATCRFRDDEIARQKRVEAVLAKMR